MLTVLKWIDTSRRRPFFDRGSRSLAQKFTRLFLEHKWT